MANAKSTAGSTPATENTESPFTEVEQKSIDRMLSSLWKITEMTNHEVAVKRLAEFRNILFAARQITEQFNKTLEIMHDFRGVEFQEVERISLRNTNEGNKAGRPKLTEAEKLAKLRG